jgi:hypothetical protein
MFRLANRHEQVLADTTKWMAYLRSCTGATLVTSNRRDRAHIFFGAIGKSARARRAVYTCARVVGPPPPVARLVENGPYSTI